MTRKITVLILLSAFLMNVFGFFKAYFLLDSKAPSTAKTVHYQRLRNEQEIVIILNKNHPTPASLGFKQVTNSEYLYHGDHYDVVKREVTSNGEKIHLKRDSFEDEIMEFLQALFGGNTTSHHAQDPAKKIFKKNIVKYFLCLDFVTTSTNHPAQYFDNISARIPDPPFLSVHLPPPRLG